MNEAKITNGAGCYSRHKTARKIGFFEFFLLYEWIQKSWEHLLMELHLRFVKGCWIRLYCARNSGRFYFLVMTETTTPAPTAPVTDTVTKPVIFLDFDGVLILPSGEWCPEAMLELNRLCLETGAAIVLTTSFRYSGSVKALHKVMLAHGFDKEIAVLGETRDLSAYRAAEKKGDLMFQVGFEKWSKGREIAAWLDAHPGATRYIVIDDQPGICAPYQSRTVVPVGAFSAGDREWALKLLEIP